MTRGEEGETLVALDFHTSRWLSTDPRLKAALARVNPATQLFVDFQQHTRKFWEKFQANPKELKSFNRSTPQDITDLQKSQFIDQARLDDAGEASNFYDHLEVDSVYLQAMLQGGVFAAQNQTTSPINFHEAVRFKIQTIFRDSAKVFDFIKRCPQTMLHLSEEDWLELGKMHKPGLWDYLSSAENLPFLKKLAARPGYSNLPFKLYQQSDEGCVEFSKYVGQEYYRREQKFSSHDKNRWECVLRSATTADLTSLACKVANEACAPDVNGALAAYADLACALGKKPSLLKVGKEWSSIAVALAPVFKAHRNDLEVSHNLYQRFTGTRRDDYLINLGDSRVKEALEFKDHDRRIAGELSPEERIKTLAGLVAGGTLSEYTQMHKVMAQYPLIRPAAAGTGRRSSEGGGEGPHVDRATELLRKNVEFIFKNKKQYVHRVTPDDLPALLDCEGCDVFEKRLDILADENKAGLGRRGYDIFEIPPCVRFAVQQARFLDRVAAVDYKPEENPVSRATTGGPWTYAQEKYEINAVKCVARQFFSDKPHEGLARTLKKYPKIPAILTAVTANATIDTSENATKILNLVGSDIHAQAKYSAELAKAGGISDNGLLHIAGKMQKELSNTDASGKKTKAWDRWWKSLGQFGAAIATSVKGFINKACSSAPRSKAELNATELSKTLISSHKTGGKMNAGGAVVVTLGGDGYSIANICTLVACGGFSMTQLQELMSRRDVWDALQTFYKNGLHLQNAASKPEEKERLKDLALNNPYAFVRWMNPAATTIEAQREALRQLIVGFDPKSQYAGGFTKFVSLFQGKLDDLFEVDKTLLGQVVSDVYGHFLFDGAGSNAAWRINLLSDGSARFKEAIKKQFETCSDSVRRAIEDQLTELRLVDVADGPCRLAEHHREAAIQAFIKCTINNHAQFFEALHKSEALGAFINFSTCSFAGTSVAFLRAAYNYKNNKSFADLDGGTYQAHVLNVLLKAVASSKTLALQVLNDTAFLKTMAPNDLTTFVAALPEDMFETAGALDGLWGSYRSHESGPLPVIDAFLSHEGFKRAFQAKYVAQRTFSNTRDLTGLLTELGLGAQGSALAENRYLPTGVRSQDFVAGFVQDHMASQLKALGSPGSHDPSYRFFEALTFSTQQQVVNAAAIQAILSDSNLERDLVRQLEKAKKAVMKDASDHQEVKKNAIDGALKQHREWVDNILIQSGLRQAAVDRLNQKVRSADFDDQSYIRKQGIAILKKKLVELGFAKDSLFGKVTLQPRAVNPSQYRFFEALNKSEVLGALLRDQNSNAAKAFVRQLTPDNIVQYVQAALFYAGDQCSFLNTGNLLNGAVRDDRIKRILVPILVAIAKIPLLAEVLLGNKALLEQMNSQPGYRVALSTFVESLDISQIRPELLCHLHDLKNDLVERALTSRYKESPSAVYGVFAAMQGALDVPMSDSSPSSSRLRSLAIKQVNKVRKNNGGTFEPARTSADSSNILLEFYEKHEAHFIAGAADVRKSKPLLFTIAASFSELFKKKQGELIVNLSIGKADFKSLANLMESETAARLLVRNEDNTLTYRFDALLKPGQGKIFFSNLSLTGLQNLRKVYQDLGLIKAVVLHNEKLFKDFFSVHCLPNVTDTFSSDTRGILELAFEKDPESAKIFLSRVFGKGLLTPGEINELQVFLTEERARVFFSEETAERSKQLKQMLTVAPGLLGNLYTFYPDDVTPLMAKLKLNVSSLSVCAAKAAELFLATTSNAQQRAEFIKLFEKDSAAIAAVLESDSLTDEMILLLRPVVEYFIENANQFLLCEEPSPRVTLGLLRVFAVVTDEAFSVKMTKFFTDNPDLLRGLLTATKIPARTIFDQKSLEHVQKSAPLFLDVLLKNKTQREKLDGTALAPLLMVGNESMLSAIFDVGSLGWKLLQYGSVHLVEKYASYFSTWADKFILGYEADLTPAHLSMLLRVDVVAETVFPKLTSELLMRSLQDGAHALFGEKYRACLLEFIQRQGPARDAFFAALVKKEHQAELRALLLCTPDSFSESLLTHREIVLPVLDMASEPKVMTVLKTRVAVVARAVEGITECKEARVNALLLIGGPDINTALKDYFNENPTVATAHVSNAVLRLTAAPLCEAGVLVVIAQQKVITEIDLTAYLALKSRGVAEALAARNVWQDVGFKPLIQNSYARDEGRIENFPVFRAYLTERFIGAERAVPLTKEDMVFFFKSKDNQIKAWLGEMSAKHALACRQWVDTFVEDADVVKENWGFFKPHFELLRSRGSLDQNHLAVVMAVKDQEFLKTIYSKNQSLVLGYFNTVEKVTEENRALLISMLYGLPFPNAGGFSVTALQKFFDAAGALPGLNEEDKDALFIAVHHCVDTVLAFLRVAPANYFTQNPGLLVRPDAGFDPSDLLALVVKKDTGATQKLVACPAALEKMVAIFLQPDNSEDLRSEISGVFSVPAIFAAYVNQCEVPEGFFGVIRNVVFGLGDSVPAEIDSERLNFLKARLNAALVENKGFASNTASHWYHPTDTIDGKPGSVHTPSFEKKGVQ